jgi:acyl-CoA reductase-like NAD-dependent aldehyde dehydrogenase
VSLELGGKSPQVVFADADLEAAANGVVAGVFAATGQTCMAGSRLLVERSVHDELLERVSARAAAVRLGDPMEAETEMGPVAFEDHLANVQGRIATAEAEGARLVTGGRRPERDGFFIEPTVFADVTMTMRIAREEIFGPVLGVFKWSDESKMLEEVNMVEYGLTCSIWTNDISTAHRTAAAVEAGFVWINEVGKHFLGVPFGGVKQSGIGREECFDEMLAFTQEKNIHVRLRARS